MKIGVAIANDRYVILDPAQAEKLVDILNSCRTIYSRVGEGDAATFFTTIGRPDIFIVRDEQVMSMSENQYEAQKVSE